MAHESVSFAWPETVPRDAIPVLVTVIRERAGMRLDKFLTVEMPRLSRTRAARIAAQYAFTTAGAPLSPARIVRAGETIVLFRPAWEEPTAPQELPVLYSDSSLLALDKPAGLAVHPTARVFRNTVTGILAGQYPGEHVALCHRLDKETSGVLLVARSAVAEARLKSAFAKRSVHKVYRAIVHGEVITDSVVDAPLALAGGSVSVMMTVRPEHAGGLPARTRIRVIEVLHGFSVVEAEPETGRQHQIRVHLAHTGHPIVGDKLYAHGPEAFLLALKSGVTDELRTKLLLDRHALHAQKITFEHPVTGTQTVVSSPFPSDLVGFLQQLRA